MLHICEAVYSAILNTGLKYVRIYQVQCMYIKKDFPDVGMSAGVYDFERKKGCEMFGEFRFVIMLV